MIWPVVAKLIQDGLQFKGTRGWCAQGGELLLGECGSLSLEPAAVVQRQLDATEANSEEARVLRCWTTLSGGFPRQKRWRKGPWLNVLTVKQRHGHRISVQMRVETWVRAQL